MALAYGEKMTTYILKDAYEQLIKRKLTKQIILIMKQTKKKEFTKKDIVEISRRYFGSTFKCDSKGHTVLRYLKTMAKYNIVTEIVRGNGRSSLWMLNDVSPELCFHVVLDNHINKLKNVARHDDSALTYKNTTIYGFFGSDIFGADWTKKGYLSSKGEKELSDIVKQFHDATQNLANFQEKVFTATADLFVKEARDACNSYIDQWIVHTFVMFLLWGFYGSFEIREDRFINFGLFEKDRFPYVLKPTLATMKGIHHFSQYHAEHKPSEKDVWKEIGNYQLSDDLCQKLVALFDVHFGYRLDKCSLFSVFCDLGSPDHVFSEMYEMEKMFQKKLSSRDFLEKEARESVEAAKHFKEDMEKAKRDSVLS